MSNKPFISRAGLIENLRNHLLAGRSAAMVGGPMIGKSTLARNLSDQIKQKEIAPVLIGLKEVGSEAQLWAAFMEAILHQGIGPDRKNPYRKDPATLPELMTQLHHVYEKAPSEIAARPLVLLLDDADALLSLPGDLPSQIVNLALESIAPSIHSICWIGGAAWETWLKEHAGELKSPLRLYPLSVIPIREAKQIIKDYLGSEPPSGEAERIWSETGGHPYLLERAFDSDAGRPEETLSERLLGQLAPHERALLGRLDPSGSWTILNELKLEDGTPPPKALLDRLCMLGLVVRTLMEGTAAIRLTSPLLMKAT